MKWIQRVPKKEYDEDDLIIDKIASIRGVYNVKDWINPSVKKHMNSPYELKNIDEMAQIIIKAVATNQKMAIIPDIDTDGICSFGIMNNYLKPLGANLTENIIHAQRSDGHGVETVLDKIPEDVEIVLIVDSSSNSVDACKTLSESGKTVLIIDHHEMDVDNPHALIVNCQQGEYKNKHLSGSAMCYKVCQVLDDYLGIEMADEFLDLATIGLVADMMSLWSMENRCIINRGLDKIKNLGIQTILDKSGIKYNSGITTTNISFKIAPILGACSRFDKIELALELIISDDEERIKLLTDEMISMNENRKREQKESIEKILEEIGEVNDNLLIYSTNEIDSGFRGLIATELVENYSKPVFVVQPFLDEKGNIIEYKGSARSIGEIKLKEMCEESGLFDFATGHSSAHGIGFKAENYDAIIKYFNDNLEKDDLQHVYYYDLELDIDDIDEMDIKDVERISRIVGQGFGEPKFRIKNAIVEEGHTKKLGNYVRAVMGSNLDTVKIHCENDFVLMKFRTNENYGSDIEEHFNSNFSTELEVIGSLNLNSFYNWGLRQEVITKQIFVNDYRIVE